MSDLMTFLDFALDLVFLVPPHDAVVSLDFGPWPLVVGVGAVVLVAFLRIVAGLRQVFRDSSSAGIGIMAVCVGALSFGSLGWETLREIFVMAYVPMVLALRTAEGVLLGARLKVWHGVFFLALLVGLSLVVDALPTKALAILQRGWVILGAFLASIAFVDGMKSHPMVTGPAMACGLFLVFLSTTLYVIQNWVVGVLYRYVLPIGMIVGVIVGRTHSRRKE